MLATAAFKSSLGRIAFPLLMDLRSISRFAHRRLTETLIVG